MKSGEKSGKKIRGVWFMEIKKRKGFKEGVVSIERVKRVRSVFDI